MSERRCNCRHLDAECNLCRGIRIEREENAKSIERVTRYHEAMANGHAVLFTDLPSDRDYRITYETAAKELARLREIRAHAANLLEAMMHRDRAGAAWRDDAMCVVEDMRERLRSALTPADGGE